MPSGTRLALALWLLGCSAPTDGMSPPNALIGGDVGTRAAFAVAVLDLRTSDLCSGVAIGRRHVLTARHCLHWPGEPIPSPSQFVVWWGPDKFRVSGSAPVTGVAVLDDAYETRTDLIGRDIAVLEVALDIDSGRLARAPVESTAASIGNVEAYGRLPGAGSGTLRARSTRVVSRSAQEIFTEPVTCDGDSGAGLVSPAGELLGIASYRSQSSCGRGTSVFSRTDPQWPWIARVLSEGVEACEFSGAPCRMHRNCTQPACTALGTACPLSTGAGRDNPCEVGDCVRVSEARDLGMCWLPCSPLYGLQLCPTGHVCRIGRGDEPPACVPSEGLLDVGETCSDDTECGTGVCHENACRRACRRGRGDCVDGESCVPLSLMLHGACMPGPPLAHPGEIGDACIVIRDCIGPLCADRSVERPGYCTLACTSESDCPEGFRCHVSMCRRGYQAWGASCSEDAVCPSAFSCIEGRCTRPCGPAALCPSHGECIDGHCEFQRLQDGHPCGSDSECMGGSCLDGTCSRPCGWQQPCRVGFVCSHTGSGEGHCVQRELSERASVGCSASPGRDVPPLHRLMVMFALVALIRLSG